ncbi:MAG: hypothetical protein KF699_08430 [Phycisphaeraceae bacterium]|nr:hypothetical protein [Phycisphaeraceae bacterium]
MLESLEPRKLLALLGVSPLADLPISFYNSSGVMAYDASTGQIDIAATPTAIFLSGGPVPIAATHGDLQIHFRVNASGGLVGGVNAGDSAGIGSINANGDDFVVHGSVNLGSGVVTGLLLSGEIVAFGFQDSGGPTDQYDMRFVPTGGLLMPFFAGNKEVGLLLTSEASSFAGSFGESFAGQAKGTFGPMDGPELGNLGGFVYEDDNDNGEIDLGEAGIAGVTVTLTGVNDAGQTVHVVTTTDEFGSYVFHNLRPGTYTITQTQPAGYNDGRDTLGTLGGSAGNDVFFNIVINAGDKGFNYNFGELRESGTGVHSGDTATIGFWQNKNGQNLIKAVNGGQNATALGNWLASMFPNMYGANAGVHNLAGKTNAQVAQEFITRFKVKGQKLDAQVMAVALACYVTDPTLAGGSMAAQYGFNLSAGGTGARLFNIGDNGAAFGVANGTTLTVLQVLQATDSMAVNGVLYFYNPSLRNLANEVYTSINETGDI